MNDQSFSFEAEGYEEAIERFYREGWTDGLPIVLPTRRLVEEMIAAGGRDRAESLGNMPPKNGDITIEKLAINAVMGGCLPEYFPIVIAAMEALQQPQHNLGGVIQTTHMSASLTIVNGPLARKLNFNSRDGVFGNGYRANAAVGRAVRLAIWNLGGAVPGQTDMCTLSNPSEYAFCIAEQEEDSPWEPLHVDRGCPEGSNAVTVFACEAPHSVTCQGSPGEMLYVLADAMAQLGSNNMQVAGQMLVVLNPRIAQEFHDAGWSKNDVRNHLWQHARRSAEEIQALGIFHDQMRQSLVDAGHINPRHDPANIRSMIPVTDRPEDILIVVAGGKTYFAGICPGWGAYGGLAATAQVRVPDTTTET